MRHLHRLPAGLALGAALLAGLTRCAAPAGADSATADSRFKVDPTWPQPVPNQWILGQVSGVATDADDRVWVLQRPARHTVVIGNAACPILSAS
jgi:hypothetical protein